MSKVLISDQYLEDIADAIRGKNGLSATYTPAQMAAAITAIPTGGGTIIEDGNGDIELGKTGDVALITSLSVTENGTYTAPANTGYSPVDVNVSGGGGENVDVQILGTMTYDIYIPINASQSGNIVSIPNDSMFVIAVSGMLDMAPTTGTVTKNVLGRDEPIVIIYPGASGGTITLEGL